MCTYQSDKATTRVLGKCDNIFDVDYIQLYKYIYIGSISCAEKAIKQYKYKKKKSDSNIYTYIRHISIYIRKHIDILYVDTHLQTCIYA